MSDSETMNRIEHRFDGGRTRRRSSRFLDWKATGLLSLLTVFALSGWQYRASLGVLETGAGIYYSSGSGNSGSHGRQPIPGSILSVDSGFVLREPSSSSLSSSGNVTKTQNQQPLPLKKILYGTKFWNHEDFLFGQGSDVFADCPVTRCWATRHAQAVVSLDEFDAVLIHPLDLSPSILAAMRQWRRPHQKFVLVYMESPLYQPTALEPLDHFIHWTMTYLWNSDIVRPYGYFVPRLQNTQQPQPVRSSDYHYAHLPSAWIPYNETEFRRRLASARRSKERRDVEFLARARRPHQVAWLVSNCETPSRREDYVRELAKHINVTIFGRCQNLTDEAVHQTCDDDDDEACYARIRRDYRFVLGFENAHCDGYVTEKFFGRVEDFVVIVRGGTSTYRRVAPPHSYVRVDDFARPRDLATYLLHGMDETEYLSYFWWRDHYRVVAAPGDAVSSSTRRRRAFGQSLCRLCERLHYPEVYDDGTPTPTYANLTEWFASQGQCTGPDAV